MPSFDAVLEPNLVELRNATEQAGKRDRHALRFQGHERAAGARGQGRRARAPPSTARPTSQIGQVREVLVARTAARRGVDARFPDFSAKIEKRSAATRWSRAVAVKTGIDGDSAKQIQGAVKQ
jgi:uncharacterized protein YajQ (UPF0234 family)